MIDPIGISYYEHAKSFHLEMIADDDLYYRHKSHLDQTYQGVSVKTNELGMRDQPILEKKQDELRIVFLGDSFVEAYQVEIEDNFCTQTGRLLQEGGFDHVETLNQAHSHSH